MAAKLKIYQGALQALAQGATTLRVYQGAVQLLWADEDYWGGEIITVSSLDGDMTVGTPSHPNYEAITRWTWPVAERLIFSTQIIQSHDRTEQRIARRQGVPARTISAKLAVQNDKCPEFEAAIHGWLKIRWRIPYWPMATRHEGALLSGSSSISIDTRYADYAVGDAVLIWESQDNFEYVYIDTVTSDTINLWANTLYDYYGAKWIMPVRFGYSQRANLERLYGGELFTATWAIEDIADVTGFSASQTYNGYTVLTEAAHWDRGRGQISHDPDFAILDANSGVFEVVSNSDYNEVVQPHIWHPWTKADCWAVRQFLHDINGRQVAFYVPTFRDDLVLTRPVAPTDTSIYIRNAGLTVNMDVNDMRMHVAFRASDGSLICRQVTGMSIISGTEEKVDHQRDRGEGRYRRWSRRSLWA
jgi:hypothetical protein